jgi:hypothetical protein
MRVVEVEVLCDHEVGRWSATIPVVAHLGVYKFYASSVASWARSDVSPPGRGRNCAAV